MKIRTIPFRRKREGKTNYKRRLKLLKSRKTRFVVRRSNKNIICQFVEYSPDGDKILVSADSRKLVKLGSNLNGANMVSAYLVGYLAGKEASKKGIKQAVLDMGLISPIQKSRIYSALKGAVDAGILIPSNDGVFPPEDRIMGKHIADFAGKLKSENPDYYQKHFSSYLKNGLTPEKIPDLFNEIKKKIDSA